MAHAQGSLYLLFDVVDYPRHRPGDDLLRLVVDVEIDIKRFGFGWIEIDLLLDETINVCVINSELEVVLWLRLVIDPNFC